ncbi:DNA-processing protein DprA [Halobacillus salinarum]|uniref:DNA-processing protein DprA n=1 Tax=Halobacillus salinarum TaxID=2932257 RepID=A0ABY4EF30_9BACI|nr:DNA-processing protein DprA [Halobacillus salinarum]UOQ43065.1 DNA-processing protein DprA [Halobacillus salinarum]
MNEFRQRLIHLQAIPAVTRTLLRKIVKVDPQLVDIYSLSPEKISSTYLIKDQRARIIYKSLHDPNIMKKLDEILQPYSAVTLFDDNFPPLLQAIPDPPFVLYCFGNDELLHHDPSLSVVGTRTPSKDAYPSMEKILLPLVREGFLLVSGLARGIDQLAHSLAVNHNGKTIAVLGSGFKHIYPANDLSLVKKLSENQLIVSEYPPFTPPKKFHFPERNRIISGLTPATLVVEARERSGSLITVDQALEQGRDVFAMPGPVYRETSTGCNQLIQQGAQLVHSYHDLI